MFRNRETFEKLRYKNLQIGDCVSGFPFLDSINVINVCTQGRRLVQSRQSSGITMFFHTASSEPSRFFIGLFMNPVVFLSSLKASTRFFSSVSILDKQYGQA